MRLSQITDGIHLLKVPFEDLYTSVFFVESEKGLAIIDCATTPEDVDTYILPTLQTMGREATHLLLTHTHGDHAGGARRLLECCPNLQVQTWKPLDLPRFSPLRDGEVVIGRLRMLALPGHSSYSVGYLDLPTKTLISGDCLQLAGVGKYVNGIQYPELYLQSIEKLRTMELDRIIASHDYVPLGSLAEGKDAVERYLEACAEICNSKFSK